MPNESSVPSLYLDPEWGRHHWCQRRRVILHKTQGLSWPDAYFRARLEWVFMLGLFSLLCHEALA